MFICLIKDTGILRLTKLRLKEAQSKCSCSSKVHTRKSTAHDDGIKMWSLWVVIDQVMEAPCSRIEFYSIRRVLRIPFPFPPNTGLGMGAQKKASCRNQRAAFTRHQSVSTLTWASYTGQLSNEFCLKVCQTNPDCCDNYPTYVSHRDHFPINMGKVSQLFIYSSKIPCNLLAFLSFLKFLELVTMKFSIKNL